MSNYNEAYRSYYSDISRRANPRGKQYNNVSVEELVRRPRKSKGNYMINLFVKQLIGAITLLMLAVIIKMSPSEEAQNIYTVSKEIVDGSYDFNPMLESIEELDIIKYIKDISGSE